MSEVKRYDLTEDFEGNVEISAVPERFEGRFVLHEDYAALQQNLDSVLAENAALKQWIEQADELWINDCDLDAHLDDVPKTPATDAWLNEMRAQGVESAAEYLFEETNIGTHEHECLVAFSVQLRAGKEGE